MMNGLEKSDLAIVAKKPANKAGKPAAEWVEPRAGTKGNAQDSSTHRTQSRASVSQGIERVRQAARQRKKQQFATRSSVGNARVLGNRRRSTSWGSRSSVVAHAGEHSCCAGTREVIGCAPRFRRSRTNCANDATTACPSKELGCAQWWPATSPITRCPPTRRRSARTGTTSCPSGGAPWNAVARRQASRGRRWIGLPQNGSRPRSCFILGLKTGLASNTQGRRCNGCLPPHGE